ncbi:MAG: hypothetical protein ACE5GW_08535 [Planctomycetota bacterium]
MSLGGSLPLTRAIFWREFHRLAGRSSFWMLQWAFLGFLVVVMFFALNLHEEEWASHVLVLMRIGL